MFIVGGDPTTLIDWVSRGGLLAGALLTVWAFVGGKLHSDKEFQREVQRADKTDVKIDRILSTQEQIVELIKQNIDKRAEISSIDDLAKLADYAREQGLIK